MPEPTGRDLDAAVCSAVFGYEIEWEARVSGERVLFCYKDGRHFAPPHFSQDWRAMREVVERMVELGFKSIDLCMAPDGWHAGIGPRVGIAATLPEAACKAALLALAALSGAATGETP
jgi:hypothetical protein